MPVKWRQWIAELEGLSADSPAWNEFAEFLAASQNIAAVKSHERETALENVGLALALLQEKYSPTLLRFGLIGALEWQAQQCPPAYALRASHDLKRWEVALEAYDELLVRVPSNPTEFQQQRRQRNDLEDEITQIGFILTTIFSGGELPLDESSSENSQKEGQKDGQAASYSKSPSPTVSAPSAKPAAVSATASVVAPEIARKVAVVAAEPKIAVPEARKPSPTPTSEVTPSPGATVRREELKPIEDSETPQNNGHVGNGSANGNGNGVPIPELKLISPSVPPISGDDEVRQSNAAEPEPAVIETEEDKGEEDEAIAVLEIAVVEEETGHTAQQAGPEVETDTEEVGDVEAEEREYWPVDCDIVAERSAPIPYLADDEPSTPVTELLLEEAENSEGGSDDESNEGAVLADGRRLLRIFISSPGDVGQERLIAAQVIERLQTEFAAYIELDPIFWEHEPLRATSHFQEQIMAPSRCDIMVCILWARLGTRLPGQFHRADGSLYESGTEWEFEDALNSYQIRGTPDLMVYRKSAEPQASMSDEAALMARLAQKRALDTFIDRWFGNAQSSFKAAFHAFPSPDAFEDLLENHLRRLIRERLPERITEGGEAPLTIRWHKGSPFRSLEAFDVEHAAIFCGRTRAISELKEALISQANQGRPFVVVFGMSGSGKSSLVRAGLLPTLLQPGVIDGVGYWRYAMFNPGDGGGLLEGLAAALLKETALPELAQNGLEANDLASLLKESPEHLIGPLRAALVDAAESAAQCENLHEVPVSRLALVIDQMEEIWTEEEADDQTRRDFVAAINVLVRSGLVWTTATMRSDFFPRCDEIPDLMSLKEGAGQYHLLPPTFAEIGQMLNQPARLAGLRFEVDPKTGNNLSDVLQEAAGKDHGALPLLQFTLDELFKRRSPDGVLSFAAYEELGGVEGALAGRAEDVFEALPPNVQAELPAVLRALVTVIADGESGDAKVAARRAPWESLAISPQRRQMVEAFIDARLLVSDGHEVDADGFPHSGIVRVAHEALLRHWPRLQEWLANDMKFLRIRARTATSAAHWVENDNSREYLLHEGLPLAEAEDMLSTREAELEATTVRFIRESSRIARRTRVRRRTIITGVTACFFVVVTGFGGFSYVKWQEAVEQRSHVIKLMGNMAYEVPTKLANNPATRQAMKQIFQSNLSVLDEVMDSSDSSKRMNWDKATNLDRIGDIWYDLGDFTKAKTAYEQSLTLMTGLVREDSNKYGRDFAIATDKVADIHLNNNDLVGAKKLYYQSLQIRRGLTDTTPTAPLLRELAISYEQIADIERQLQDYSHSQGNFDQAWAIRVKLSNLQPDNSQFRRDLIVCSIKTSDLYIDQNELQKGRAVLERILKTAQQSATPDNPQGQRDLAGMYDRLTALCDGQGNVKQAITYQKEGLKLSLLLAEGGDDAQTQQDVVSSLMRIGTLYMKQGDVNGALNYYAQAQPKAEQLAQKQNTLAVQTALLDCYVAIGDAKITQQDWLRAHEAYMLALGRCSVVNRLWSKDSHCILQAAACHGQLAYIKVMTKQFAPALQEAKTGASLDPTASWIKTTLAEAYVLNNQLQPAMQVCQQNRNEDVSGTAFGQVVLNDLNDFEKGGITNPNFAKLRAWILASKMNIPTVKPAAKPTPVPPTANATPLPTLPQTNPPDSNDNGGNSGGDNGDGGVAA